VRPVIRLAAALALLCNPALAEVTVTIVEPDATGYIGQIVHHNRWGFGIPGEQLLRLETDRGDFLIRLITTENRNCVPACPDTIEMWQWPSGVVPELIEATTPEHGVSVIRLYLWSGM